MKYVVVKSKCLTNELSEDVCNVLTTEHFLLFKVFNFICFSTSL